MGLFGTSKKLITTRAWKNRIAALRGLGVLAMTEMKAGNSVVVVTFFDDRFEDCRNFLTENQIPFSTLDDVNLVNKPASLYLVRASQLGRPLTGINKLSTVLFYGRYPIKGWEESVEQKLPACEQKFYCVSLEDPFFQLFGGDRVKLLMEQLGMKDDEFVEHSMIDRSIGRAQEKLAGKIRSETKTGSEEEWYRRNASSI